MRRLGSVLVATAMLIGSALATGPATAAVAGEPCADLNVSASPPILPPGDPLTITGSVTNCSEEAEQVTVRARVTGPCNFELSHSFRVRLEPGQTLGDEVTFPAPECEGGYRIGAKAGSQGMLLDRAVDTFKVCEQCQGTPRLSLFEPSSPGRDRSAIGGDELQDSASGQVPSSPRRRS